MTDDRRRVVLPDIIPARSPVTIQMIDQDTVIVRRQHPRNEIIVVQEPDIEHLTDEPEFDALAEKAARAVKLPPFDEL